uniref:Uncharacterized protein n=1 Tax=Timema genevievae TaxID=629358 RepID=A0A7R9PQ61_TIMGE|nr:unnamed protein product [Timema genevievae]
MAMSGNHKFGISRSFSKQGHVKDVHTLIWEQLGQECILDGGIIPSSFIETNVDILCVKYTANHEYLAVGFTDGYVRLFRPRKGECVFSLMDTETLENPVPVSDIKHRLSSRANPVSDTITTSYVNGCVKGWKYESGHCVYTIHEHRQTLGLEFHRRSPKFLTVGNDSIIYMYDEETRTQEQVFKSSDAINIMDGHTSRVFCARFHPRNNYEFVSGGWDNTIQFWDIRQQFSVRNFGGVHICGNGIDISQSGTEVHYLVHIVHSGGTKLLTCSWQPEDPIKLWDYGSGKLISVVKPDIFLSKISASSEQAVPLKFNSSLLCLLCRRCSTQENQSNLKAKHLKSKRMRSTARSKQTASLGIVRRFEINR